MILITVQDFPRELKSEIENYTKMTVVLNNDIFSEEINLVDIKILITYGFDLNEKSLALMTNLKWIQIFQTGIEHVPLHLINEETKLSNVKDIYGKPMSEYVMSIVLYQIREIERFNCNKLKKLYERSQLVDEANEKTIGIFGTGTIGQEVARKAKAFDMEVLGFNSNARDVAYFDKTYCADSKHEMIKKCDFIVLLLPLTEKTRHIINYEEFNQMKKDAYIINIGRSGLINTSALVQSITSKRIKGAALDVFDKEPLPIDSELWDLENLIITPHISGKTKHFFHRCISVFEKHFDSFKDNKKMQFNIDKERKY